MQWPNCRRFGRMPTYLIATVAFIGATMGCVFAPSAEVLVLFRALQGAGGEQGCRVQWARNARSSVCYSVAGESRRKHGRAYRAVAMLGRFTDSGTTQVAFAVRQLACQAGRLAHTSNCFHCLFLVG